MRSATGRGRVYRRCGCRDAERRQLGARCSRLAVDPEHGSWTFAVDVPDPERARSTVRRGGFSSRDDAHAALVRFLQGADAGFNADPNQTVAGYLTAWLQAKQLTLKPTTLVRYQDYVVHDLIPALGHVRLDELGYAHIAAFTRRQLADGRGKVTVHRCLATLSSALGDAVRHHRIPDNPARPTAIRRPQAAERRIWTVQEAVTFLDFCHVRDPLFADLVEVLIGTGIRKGEALGLQWNDVHLSQRVLYIRRTLSAINNNQLLLTAPKTRSSKNWVAISPRVARALRHQATSRTREPGGHCEFVFHRDDGRPVHPEYALNHFHHLCRQAGVRRVTLHDLRHLSATISITAGIPLAVVSKTLRHSTLSTTVNIYAHLTTQAARQAVDAINHTLDHATPPTATPAPPATTDQEALNEAQPADQRRIPTAHPHHSPRRSRARPPCDHHTRTNGKGRPRITAETAYDLRKSWSGRQDLNLRPLDPQSGRSYWLPASPYAPGKVNRALASAGVQRCTYPLSLSWSLKGAVV
ncbi:tyrosine-type recombinase/integrase [Streptomyces sp. 549]|uniref:tyrosine-type recombinase/integrase n=1 Tax=Streptomyces sp. 549 TaxID=3049076 RepID=UPI0024C32958|nr:site-specific integrase [Streptomyces sp. 549]MDK1471826.1 tyrosine-type recombinase/integrase [Streptomyces sp. 549]